MFSKNHLKNIISISLLVFSAFFLMHDFASRSFENPLILSIIFTSIFTFVIYKIDKIELSDYKFINEKFLLIILVVWGIGIITYGFYFDFIPPNNFSNVYNEIHKSLLRPTLSIISVPLIIWCILKSTNDIKTKIIRSILIISHPAIYMLFVNQSRVLFLISLILFIVIFTENNFTQLNIISRSGFILFILSIITSILLPYTFIFLALFLIYFFRENIYYILFSLIIVLVLATLIYQINYLDFILLNKIEFNFLIGLILFVSIYVGWSLSSKEELLLSFSILIIIAGLTKIEIVYYKEIIINELYLISTLLIFVINNYKVDKFLGKVL